ncbi:MAG: hypothetical protein HYT87_14345 [Nitrospirae bacterium]|nr:hypothetical protein [Nitrospirota bacterium]
MTHPAADVLDRIRKIKPPFTNGGSQTVAGQIAGLAEQIARFPLPDPGRKALRSVGLLASMQADDLFTYMPHMRALRRFGQQIGGVQSTVLLITAFRSKIFERFPAEGGSVEALARKFKLNRRALEPFLNALTAMGYLQRDGKGTYDLSEFSRTFLVGHSPYSLAPVLALLSQSWTSFMDLADTLRTGKSPKAMDIFDRKNPTSRGYIHVVNAQLRSAHRAFMERVDVSGVRRFIVGSAGVSFAAALLEANPKAQVVFACLPHLVDEIPDIMKDHGIATSRVDSFHRHSGDPWKDTWDDTGEGYDMVFLTRKLSLKPLSEFGKKFLGKAFQSLKPGGRAVVWEPILNDDKLTPRGSAVQAAMDLFFNQGGQTPTLNEIVALMREAGFPRVRRVDVLGGSVSYLIGTKPAVKA